LEKGGSRGQRHSQKVYLIVGSFQVLVTYKFYNTVKAKSIENINIPEPVTILVFNFDRATVHFIRQAP